MQKSYIITGGAGFIGSHTVDALVGLGEKVTILDIKPYSEAVNIHHQKDKITYIEGDIRDTKLLLKLFKDHTHVLHLAAIVSVPLSIENPIETHDTNVNETLSVLDAARRSNIKRVVYASSAAVYGDTSLVPTKEDSKLSPMSPYGLHKLMNEHYAKLYTNVYGVETVGLRYFNVFGKRQDPSSPYSGVISIFADRLRRDEQVTIYGDGSATRDFVHINNIVSANLEALNVENIASNIFNVGSGTETSISKLFSTMNSIAGKNHTAKHKDNRDGDIQRSCASIEKISKETGYNIKTSLEDGLGDVLSIV